MATSKRDFSLMIERARLRDREVRMFLVASELAAMSRAASEVSRPS